MIFALGAAVLLAAYLLARAAGLRRAPEVALATWCLASMLVLVPTYLLAGFGILTRAALEIATLLLAVACVASSILLRGGRAALDDLRALAPALGTRSLILVPLALVLAHALVATWLLPSEGWDGIWYHDTIVGWTIQSRSLAPMPLPPNLLQQVNGFPRNAEMTSVWIALIDGRRLIELPNTLAIVPFALASGLLAERATKRKAIAIGLASIAALAPGAILQLRTTYVDVYAAAACLASVHFATKRPLAARDVVLAGFALALHLGAKPTALLVAPIVLAVALARQTSARRGLAAAAAVGLFGLAAFSVYGRNWALFDNPVYPLAVDLDRFGIHWQGIRSTAELDANTSTAETLTSIFGTPSPGRDFADIRDGGYGLAVARVLFPLALAGTVRAFVVALRAPGVARARARWLLVLVAIALPSLALSPALWSARYQLHAVGLACAPAAYALDARWVRRAAWVPIALGLAFSVIAIARFSPPLGDASLARLTQAWAMPREERACATRVEWTIAPEVARERETLHAGDLTVFGDGVTFPSVLYDEAFENRVQYVPETTLHAIDVALQKSNPRWIVANPEEPLYRYAEARPNRWRRVGLASQGQPTYAFSRIDPRDPR